LNDADGSRVVLVDTVGFVRDLPHELVAAFRATLEETREAQLLLHVIDATDPLREAKIEQVNQVLAEIGASGVPQLEVFNKLDKLNGVEALPPGLDGPNVGRVDRDEGGRPSRVWVSAARRTGLAALMDAMKEAVANGVVRERIRLPIHAGRLRARVFEVSRVVSEHPGDDGEWVMEVEIEQSALRRLCRSEGVGCG
jgi:GTP-binding protein HflX